MQSLVLKRLLLCWMLSCGLCAAAEETVLRVKYAGGEIYGVLHRPDGAQGALPLVIAAHGFNGTHHFARGLFEPLARAGYQCFAFDFSCGSAGSRTNPNTMEMSVPDEREAMVALVDYFGKHPFVDRRHIVLHGESQGGLVAALAAASRPRDVERLVLVYPAFCIPDNWRDRYPHSRAIPDTTMVWGVPMGPRFFREVRDMDPYALIGKFRRPVLIVQGDKDPVVALPYAERAAETYRDARLKVIPGAGHGFAGADWDTYIYYVSQFLQGRL